MLGEEDVRKQVLNKEIETPKDNLVTRDESPTIANAFTLEDSQLRAVVKELDPTVIDTERVSHQIKEIVDYIRQSTGAKGWNDILWEIRLLSKEIGNDVMGQSQLQRLFRYVYLQSERSDIDRELKKDNYVRVR